MGETEKFSEGALHERWDDGQKEDRRWASIQEKAVGSSTQRDHAFLGTKKTEKPSPAGRKVLVNPVQLGFERN